MSRHRILLVFVIGCLSACGFAPLDWWPITLLALALLIDSVHRASRTHDAFILGLVFGVGHFLVGLNWIATAFSYQSNMPAWLGWVSVVLVSSYMALFPATCCLISWRLAARQHIAFAFTFSALWMLGEWLRGSLLTGFAWDPIGMVWLDLPSIAHAARWIGIYGLSGLTLLISGLLVPGRRWGWLPALAIATLLLVAGVWPATTQLPATQVYSASAIPIRVVQPNIGQDQKYDPARAEHDETIYASLSGPPSPTPRLLLWPEGALLHYLELEPDALANVTALLGAQEVLLTGGPSVTLDPNGGDDDIYRNSVYAVDSAGTLLWRYDKAHLVPFGEYLPLRPILSRIGVSRLLPGDLDFTAGPGPRSFQLANFNVAGRPVSVGVQICYEIIFSGRVIDESHRPSFLFNPSNDAWFGAWGPPQHLAQARMRAIEEGVPVIRATPNGISALIDPSGTVIASVARRTSGVIDGFIPDPLPRTFFARFGLFASLGFGLVLFCTGLIVRAQAWQEPVGN